MLGQIVGAGSKSFDPSQIKTLMDLPFPELSSQLKRLLGLFAYNARGVADYSNEVAPLLAAPKTTGISAQSSFSTGHHNSQEGVASAALWISRASEPLVLQTDASGNDIGATLCLGDQPVAFFSRTLKHSEMVYSTVERETMTIFVGFRRSSDLLRTSRVVDGTNQKAVSFIFGPNSTREKMTS